ncbi:MAG TPA: TRAP transporter fused permease subunit [Thermomicrobiales bacterium]|nr:TRAP transporter fused permease subunit [Thermomicrobiales bacterium]
MTDRDKDREAQHVDPQTEEAQAESNIELKEVNVADFEAESPTRQLSGPMTVIVAVIAIGLSVYALYATRTTIPAQTYRTIFLAIVLVLTFLLYPARRRNAPLVPILDVVTIMVAVAVLGYPLVDNSMVLMALLAVAVPLVFIVVPGLAGGNGFSTRSLFAVIPDGALVVLSVIAALYPLWDFDNFIYRAARPNETDVLMGVLLILLVVEATRRTVGWILPAVAVGLIAYGRFGDMLSGAWGHRGYDVDRMVGTLYISLEGIYGVPLDVAATYIILFTIYGAVLEFSGAGKFFLDFSFAATGRRASGAGRTTTIAGFLLGTVSGSGVATTVTLGSVAWPMLRKAGYDPESGGAVLSAAGIGAILSPPTLGAAAFLIAEFLQISYLEVIKMAMVPTILYYLCIFLMIELDARRMGTRAVIIETLPLKTLTMRYWYHFTSLIAIVVLMIMGFTPITAVFWAIVLAFLLSFLRRETALTPIRTAQALRGGAVGTLSVAATTATAGIIVGIMVLTGLGLKMSDLIVDLANNNLFLTVLFTGIAVWVLGLAVPVTASYIIAAAITAPALTTLGVPDVAAHMFIFYYAVLSEVSPPTALSPFAAAAITGANPFKTMMVTWKYTLPAFIVPFMFTLNTESGVHLLAIGDVERIILATVTACLAIVALVAGVGGWVVQRANMVERAILIVAAGLLLYTGPVQDAVGLTLMVIGIGVHWLRVRGQGSDTGGEHPVAVA